MTGLGLAFLKTEGAHIHPDDPNFWVSDDDMHAYEKQLRGYMIDNNLKSCASRHQDIADKIAKELANE